MPARLPPDHHLLGSRLAAGLKPKGASHLGIKVGGPIQGPIPRPPAFVLTSAEGMLACRTLSIWINFCMPSEVGSCQLQIGCWIGMHQLPAAG